jgi:hypothetical protein
MRNHQGQRNLFEKPSINPPWSAASVMIDCRAGSCVHKLRRTGARAYWRIAYLLRPFLRRGSNGRYIRTYGVAETICEAGGAMPRWNLPPKGAFSHR